MNRTWIALGLVAVSGTIILSGCDGRKPSALIAETNADTAETDSHFSPDIEVVDIALRAIKDTEYLRDAGMWANCDPASTYPRKDPSKCNVGYIELVSDDE